MSFESWKKNRAWTAAALLAVLLIVSVVSVLAQGQGPGTKVVATLYSTFNGAGWVGNAILVVGENAPVQATYWCPNPASPPIQKPGGAIYGIETCTYTLPDGSFEVLNQFTALPDSAPGLYTMHTISTITKGTGRFEKASGQLIERAQFILTAGFPVPLPALGRSEGVVFGIQ